MNSSMARLPTPEGPGSVSEPPHLPEGFTSTFTSRYVDTRDLRQHVVTGGDGPPLLPVHGWPQTWYAWRLVMPGLARDFQVVAPDPRGCGRGAGYPASPRLPGYLGRGKGHSLGGNDRRERPKRERHWIGRGHPVGWLHPDEQPRHIGRRQWRFGTGAVRRWAGCWPRSHNLPP
jgi:hypothetical protein